MSGAEFMDRLVNGEAARTTLPLEYTPTPPLPIEPCGRRIACWYYRIEPSKTSGGLRIASPALIAVWDADSLALTEWRWLDETEIEADVPAPEYLSMGSLEQRYMEGPFDEWLRGLPVSEGRIHASWLETMPEPLRRWVESRPGL